MLEHPEHPLDTPLVMGNIWNIRKCQPRADSAQLNLVHTNHNVHSKHLRITVTLKYYFTCIALAVVRAEVKPKLGMRRAGFKSPTRCPESTHSPQTTAPNCSQQPSVVTDDKNKRCGNDSGCKYYNVMW